MMLGQAGKRALPKKREGRSALSRSPVSLILRPTRFCLRPVRFRKAVGAAIAALLAAAPIQAQEGVIAGRVTNVQTREPVNAAQVFIPAANTGVLTDRDGRYRLAPVPAGQVAVEVRLIGYRTVSDTVTVTPGRQATLDFELEVSAVRLEDVTVNVVTGLERRRRQQGTNTGNIDVEELNQATIQNFTNLLTGRTEGLILNEVSGSTGTRQRIRIRGSSSISLSNEPLIIVDGVFFTTKASYEGGLGAGFTGGQDYSRLNDLNPEEVESIEVIKGPAAAALYGAMGSNGVLLITTKRGSPGGTDWHFHGEVAELEDRTDYPLNYSAIQVIGDGDAPVFNEDGFNSTDFAACNNHETAAGDCVQDRFLTFSTLRDPRTTPFQKGDRAAYGISISGGTPTARYFLSGQYKSEDGVVKFDYNGEEKYNVRTNLDAALDEDLNASLSIGFVSRDVRLTNNDNSIFSVILAGIDGMAGFVPGGHPNPETGGPNPLNYLFNRNLQDLGEASLIAEETDRITASVNARWQPTSWLSAQGTAGIDLISYFDFVTVQPGLDNLTSTWVDGFRNAAMYQRQNWTGNASMSATFDIPGTGVTSVSTVGASYQEELVEGTECFGTGLVPGTASCSSVSRVFRSNFQAGTIDEQWVNVVTVGAFFQQEFSWEDKLFLTGSVRMDDDSNFGGHSKLQVYPSAWLSYMLSDEDWFPAGRLMSELRLRGAFGTAGLRPTFRDAITLFGPITVTFGGKSLPGVTLSETGNELLKPERSTEWEVGFDLGLLNDRVGIGFTYFDKYSKDALIDRPLPPSYGLTASMFQNIGEIRNRGTEMSLRALALEKRDARVNITLLWTTLENEVVKLGVEPIVLGDQRHKEGFPAGSFHSKPFTFNDADGNGLLSIAEVEAGDEDEFINEAFPTWTASLNLDVELFQFLRLRTLFDARGGYAQRNLTEDYRCDRFFMDGRGCEATAGQNASLEDQARWIASRFHGTNTGFLEDADFIKWREVSFTLTAPPSLASKHVLLERTSLTFSGRNLRTFTDYSGLDPEANDGGVWSNFRQREFNTQPPIRVFTLRLDVRF